MASFQGSGMPGKRLSKLMSAARALNDPVSETGLTIPKDAA